MMRAAEKTRISIASRRGRARVPRGRRRGVQAHRRARREAMPPKCTVLTHCNAGALATGGYGTALGVVRAARASRASDVRVVACETRPVLQGARLTAWELARDGFRRHAHHRLDGRRSSWRAGEVRVVVVGADRIARNGDVANKIGTYGRRVPRARARRAVLRRGAVVAPSTSRAPTARPSPSSSASEARGAARSRRHAHRARGRRASTTPRSTSPRRASSGHLHRARRGRAAGRARARPAACYDGGLRRERPERRASRFAPKPAVAQGPRARRRDATRTSRRRSARSTSTRSARRRAARTSASAGARAPRRSCSSATRARAAAASARSRPGNPRGAVDVREPEHVARALSQLAAAVRRHDDGRSRRPPRRRRGARREDRARGCKELRARHARRDAPRRLRRPPRLRRHHGRRASPTSGRTTSRSCGASSAPSATCAAATSSRSACSRRAKERDPGAHHEELDHGRHRRDRRRGRSRRCAISRGAGVDIVTLGQYLRPDAEARARRPLRRARRRSTRLADEGSAMGFAYVASGPLVRSSYKAAEVFVQGSSAPRRHMNRARRGFSLRCRS